MEQKKIPRHVAIIMDGNGRWAERRKLPRKMGHAEGCKVLEQTVRDAADLGIGYLTVYAFSTENWKRSEEEVSALMVLMGFYIKKLLKVAEEENVRVKIIGERSRFAPDLVKGLNKLEYETRNNTRMVFAIAINYGARDEMRNDSQGRGCESRKARAYSYYGADNWLLSGYCRYARSRSFNSHKR